MAVSETVQGRYHTLVSDSTGVANILSELTAALTSRNVNPTKIVDIDVTSKFVLFFN
jgi:hypothetical protein